MKTKILSSILIIFIFLICFTSINIKSVFSTGITRVQGNYKGNSTAINVTVTLGSTPTSGNILIATIGVASSGFVPTVSTVKDGNNHITWTRQINYTYVGGGVYVDSEIWLGVISSGASKTQNVTLTGITAQGAVVNICEYSGIANTSFLDKTGYNTGTSSIPDTGTTATTTKANELWIGATILYTGAGNQSSPTNSFTLLDGINSVHCSNAYLEKIVSSTGTANSGTTDSGGVDNWVGCIATFIASGTTTTLNGTITETLALISAKTVSFTAHGLSNLASQILSKKTVSFSVYGLSSLDTQIQSKETMAILIHGLANLVIQVQSGKTISFNPSGLIIETFTTVGNILVARFVFLFGKILFDTSVIFTNYYWLLASFAFDYSILIVLLFLLASNIVLCIKRVPIISFVVGLFSFVIGVYEVDNTTIPANPLFSVMLCLVGIASILINILDMREK